MSAIAFEALVVLIIVIGVLPIATPWKVLIWIGTVACIVYLLRRGSRVITIFQPPDP